MILRFSGLSGVMILLALPIAAQTHPDLQGNWTNSSLTPLERPAALAGKSVLSEAEAAAWEKQTKNADDRDRRDGSAEADVARAYNALFFEQGAHLSRFGGSLRTSLIIDPPDGRVPAYTAEAQKRLDAVRAEARRHPADGAANRSLAERCLYWATAGPPMLPGPYNNNYQIVQTADYVMILSEMIHEARIIPLDGRKHLGAGCGCGPAIRSGIGKATRWWWIQRTSPGRRVFAVRTRTCMWWSDSVARMRIRFCIGLRWRIRRRLCGRGRRKS